MEKIEFNKGYSFDYITNQDKVNDIIKLFDKNDIELAGKHKLLKGVNYLVDMICVTLGAKGKNVLYNDLRTGKPRITKDGVTVANNVFSADVFENMAIEIVKESSQRTVKTAGDGTTTTAIFARYLVNEGMYMLHDNQMNYYDLSKLLDEMLNLVIDKLKRYTYDVENNFDKLLHVATVSSNSKEIGQFLFDIVKTIGIYGYIEVKKSNYNKDKVDIVSGIKVNKGYAASQFLTDHKRMVYEAKQVFIVQINDVLRDIDVVYNSIKFIKNNYDVDIAIPNILFMVNDIQPTLMDSLIRTKIINPEFNVMFVENDGFGDRRIEIMNDISIMTSGSHKLYLDGIEYPIGYADEVIVDVDTTSIINGERDDEAIAKVVDEVIEKINNPEQYKLDDSDVKYLKRRIATLKGGVAVINVGGSTEVEMLERTDRIEDAVEAVKCAIDRGVCIGGGYTLAKIHNELIELINDEQLLNLVDVLIEPLLQLCINSHKYTNFIKAFNTTYNEITNNNKGYNVIDETYNDLDNYNIYDACGVLIDSLTNAVSVAKSILSIERSLYNE